jgi:hypothetical protein
MCAAGVRFLVVLGMLRTSPPPKSPSHSAYRSGNALTIRIVSRLTRTTWPTKRTMYSSSSARFGSERMPLRLSSLTWYWSMTHSRALRLPRRFANGSDGMPARVSDGLMSRPVADQCAEISGLLFDDQCEG